MKPPTAGSWEKVRNYLLETNVISGSKARLLFVALLRLLKRKFPAMRAVFDKLLQSSSDRRLIVRNAIGTFRVLPTDDSVAKAMPHFEKKCHDWLKNDRRKLFVDIGANIGFYTILATGRYGYQTAVSFEPNPAVYKVLEENIALNNLQGRVKCFNLALGEKRQTLPFCRYLSHTGRSGFTESENAAAAKDQEEQEVIQLETSVFDDFIEKQNIDPMDIAFVKIDVEGFELSVLKGMTRTLRQISNVKLLVEINSKNKFKAQTMSLLKELGFVFQDQIGINHLFAKGSLALDTIASGSNTERLEPVPLPSVHQP